MKNELAARGQDVQYQIALAHGAPAGEYEQVVLQAVVDSSREIVKRIDGRAMRHRNSTVVGDNGRERKAVDVVNLSGPEWLARLDQLVAGGQDSDPRLDVHLHVAAAQRSDCANPARRELHAGAKHLLPLLDVGAPRPKVLSRAYG